MFFERIHDAWKAGVDWCGGPKALGAKLWPSMAPDDAGRKLRACLNPDRNEKLSEDERMQLLAIFREKGFHGVVHFMCDKLAYERPNIVAPKTAAQALAEQIAYHAREMQRLADEHAVALAEAGQKVGAQAIVELVKATSR